MTKRPDKVTHPDETVLRVMRCASHSSAQTLAQSLGISRNMADRWFYRSTKRAVLLAHEHGLTSVPYQVAHHPRGTAARGDVRRERSLIRAIMAGAA